MRKPNLKIRHTDFDENTARYRAFLQKIVNAQRVVSTPQEKRDVAESILLRLVANWEYFVDEHLVACVNRDHSQMSDFLGVTIPSHPNMDLCRALIFGGGFRDFRDFGALVGFSKKILPVASNPFLAISKSHRNKIDEVYKLRNYLAHYSAKASRSLWHMYKSKYRYERWIEPGKFLLANGGTRLWTYFDAFEGVSSDMKKWY